MGQNENALDENILYLEDLATQVLELKNLYRQRRPIVIEFCGSPKAGKTSSINSLNIFLKRNGFKTVVLAERASVCPISNKQSPIFNVWTCTSTINEINEVMDQAHKTENIDIIIADRGIFDALCWFRWLYNHSKMNNEEYDVLSKFATLYRWQKNIDLVYIFVTTPQESIKREYANLLTKKRGSIMNENILSQYREAIDIIRKEYQNEFRATEIIDTTNMSQNEVGFEVTKKTLETLRNMLMEKIGYLRNENLSLKYGLNPFNILEIELNKVNFDLRNTVEDDDRYIQPIPVAVITTEQRDKILCIKKTEKSTSKSSPESGKTLLYAGGHIRKEDMSSTDKSFLATACNTLERELNEELGLSISIDKSVEPFLLYCPDNSKSKKHLAIIWIVTIDEDTKLSLDTYEIIQRKGTSKSGVFLPIAEMNENNVSLESWSRQILLNLFCDKIDSEFKEFLVNNNEQLDFDTIQN